MVVVFDSYLCRLFPVVEKSVVVSSCLDSYLASKEQNILMAGTRPPVYPWLIFLALFTHLADTEQYWHSFRVVSV